MSVTAPTRMEAPSALQMADFFERVRATTERLTRPLSAEDCCIQSMPDASPAKWHLAHTTWFFEQFVLQRFIPGYLPFDEQYRFLFNSYYNAVGPQHCRARRGVLSRPALDQIYAYRRDVNRLITDLLRAPDPAWEEDLNSLVTIGLQHEQQHQELLITDIKHVLSCNPVLPAYTSEDGRDKRVVEEPSGTTRPMRWEAIEPRVYEIGAGEACRSAFDNERPRHKTYLQACALASRLVTNAEYLAFLEDGGYRRPAYWLSLGWQAVQESGWAHPLYWYQPLGDERVWYQYTLFGPRALDPLEPVCHLSYFEADAYARWAGARLPTEVEWEVAAQQQDVRTPFIEPGALHPREVSDDPAGGLDQVFGHVWQWTCSPYTAYPGFVAPPGALGEYNGKFMCNQYVLRGGSCVTPRDQIRTSYRNFFPPDARWQFAGLRLACDR